MKNLEEWVRNSVINLMWLYYPQSPFGCGAYSRKLRAISDNLAGLLVRIYTLYTRDRKWSADQYTSALLCVETGGLHITTAGVLSQDSPRSMRRDCDTLSQSRHLGIPLPVIIKLILHFLALRLQWPTPLTSLKHLISEAQAVSVSLYLRIVTDLKHTRRWMVAENSVWTPSPGIFKVYELKKYQHCKYANFELRTTIVTLKAESEISYGNTTWYQYCHTFSIVCGASYFTQVTRATFRELAPLPVFRWLITREYNLLLFVSWLAVANDSWPILHFCTYSLLSQ